MLEFCPVCKKVLERGEWRGKIVGKCSCGFIRTSGLNIQGEEILGSRFVGSGISEGDKIEGFNFTCLKCGFDKCEAKELGEILGNEKSVTLFTCLKCGNVERK